MMVYLLLGVGMSAYVLTGGADFGGGVWDLLARGPRAAAQRERDRPGDRADLGGRTTSG